LDVGCATGTLFQFFPKQDYQLCGVDTSGLGADQARDRYGADVFCGTIQEAAYPSQSFDVVTVLDTLYYVPQPLEELREIHRILKDDGILALEIPGYRYSFLRERGILCWLLDRRWQRGLADSKHLFYFSPRTIRLLMERAGFEFRKMVPEQASLGRTGALGLLNDLHFALARSLFRVTGGSFSFAGKELYLAVKKSSTFPEIS